jgi:hypothetical protein
VPSLTRLCRRIDDRHACGVEVASVEGHDCQIMRQRADWDIDQLAATMAEVLASDDEPL